MARQPPPYTDTPAGPQDLVRPSLGHLVGGEQVGEEFRLLLLIRTRLGRHTLGATAAAVERNSHEQLWAGAWRPPRPDLVQRLRPFELESLGREEADVRAVLGNALGEGLPAPHGAGIRGEHLLLPRHCERHREVEGAAEGRLESELPQLHRRLRGLSIGSLLRRYRAGLRQLALSRGTKDSRHRASWADEPPRAAPSFGPLIEPAGHAAHAPSWRVPSRPPAAYLHAYFPTTTYTHRQRRRHTRARTTAGDGWTQHMDG